MSSLPVNFASKFPSSRDRDDWPPIAFDEQTNDRDAVYAVPLRANHDLDVVDSMKQAPLLPPPLSFRSPKPVNDDFIPIATKVSHTYANVSPAINPISNEFESSFRPGKCAQLSADDVRLVGTYKTRQLGRVSPMKVGDQWQAKKKNALSSVVPAVYREDDEVDDELSCEAIKSQLRDEDDMSSMQLLPPPPLPSSLDQLTVSASRPVGAANGRAVSAQTGGGPPSTKPTEDSSSPSSSSVKGGGVSSPPRGRETHADAIRQAVLMRREFVETADMGDVAATIEQKVLRARPLHRVIYKADRTKETVPLTPRTSSIHHPPAAVVPPRAAVTMRGSASAGQLPTTAPVVSTSPDCTASNAEESSSDFLALAERARQEYVKRRMSAVCLERAEASTAVGDRGAHQTTADAAMQRRRYTVVGEVAVDVPDISNFEVNSSRADMSIGGANDALSRQSFLADQRDAASSIDAVATAAARSRCASTSYSEARTIDLNDVISSVGDYDSLIVPPPPDFRCESGNTPDPLHTPSSEIIDGFISMTPPPPPEFDDTRRRHLSDVACRPVSSWNVDDVARWLDSLQMSEHRDHFVESGIDGVKLMQLGRTQLIELGVTQVGQRMNLERSIKRIQMMLDSFVM